ncbi:butyrophilin subfamily 2 member A2-like isoform X4 [Epinephelus fuscoguttatus]|uniref:butyrophilin subfamily 2 member A2-like isoform X4 n=1 Tax=Epinephelus fuscoguttatus TaxID=293821 RepID=UPI0020D1855C|nr:butyrophilin subfamily 2 member A2-like isoform X4 [Epinephelus fuscoguttatus]
MQQILILSALMAPFLLLLFPLCAAASDQHVTVHPGDDVTLRCEAGNVPILVVEWTRPDLEPPQYVLLYSDGHYDTDQQHPSFKGRVELVDRELKGGDVSLTLKNVTSSDAGTYECRVLAGASTRTERALIKTDPITVIHLEVRGSEKENSMGGNTESEHPVNGNFPHGYVGLAAGVVAVLLVAAAVFAVWRYTRRMYQRSERPAAAEAGNNQFMFPSAVCDSST